MIKKYCKQKNITIKELAHITNLNFSYLYMIQSDPTTNISIGIINRIYQGTKKKYGEGLTPYEYLDTKLLRPFTREVGTDKK